jgi:hypothetical protein
MAEAYVKAKKTKLIPKENKDKVKRQLFCEEKIEKPVRVFFFLGAKKENGLEYYCIPCFERLYKIDTDIETKYLCTGEKEYIATTKPTLDDYCACCNTELYKIIDHDEVGTIKFK